MKRGGCGVLVWFWFQFQFVVYREEAEREESKGGGKHWGEFVANLKMQFDRGPPTLNVQICSYLMIVPLYCMSMLTKNSVKPRKRQVRGERVGVPEGRVRIHVLVSLSLLQSQRRRLNSFEQLKLSRAVRYSHQRRERAPVSEESRLQKLTTQVTFPTLFTLWFNPLVTFWPRQYLEIICPLCVKTLQKATLLWIAVQVTVLRLIFTTTSFSQISCVSY